MIGNIILGDVADRTEVLVVTCSRCDLVERYPLQNLIARHGSSFSVPHLLRLLSADCPKRVATSHYDLCRICCPDLPKLFPLPPRRSY
jgi:uncharacterized protein YprB with RNaseH-like and TPR domain